MMRFLSLKFSLKLILSVVALYSSSAASQDLDKISLKNGIKVSGGLNLNNTFFASSDTFCGREDYVYTLCGNLNVNLFGIDLPFSAAISNTNRSYAQPFNRFQVAPKYKWVKLYFGSSNLNFSQYTLAGRTFSGVGMELTPGKWYVGGMYGRLAKAVEYDPLKNNISTVSYKRMGYGAKVGYHGNTTEANAIFFSAEDKASSLQYYIPPEADLHPQRNTAASIFLRQAFLKYFFIQAEYAASIYNSEIRNRNGEKIETSNFIDRMFGRKGNDRFVDALNASLGYQGDIWGLGFCYERVAPNYTTLGGYYFTNDIEDFSFTPNVKLWNGKLSADGKIGWEYNNLDGMSADKTTRFTGMANLSYTDSKNWNASASYSNFTTYTKFRQEAYPHYVDDLDTLNFHQVQQSFSASAGYSFGKDRETLVNTISASSALQSGKDASAAASTAFSANISFAESFIARKLSWAVFLAANISDTPGMECSYYGPGVNLQKTLLSDKLSLGLGCAYNYGRTNGTSTLSMFNSSLSGSYALTGKESKSCAHSVSFSVGLTNQIDTGQDNGGYEFLSTLNYAVSF